VAASGRSRLPILDGAINGQKIGILLDTGADISLVRLSAATKLGLTDIRP